MILDVPFVYTVSAIPPRHRSPREIAVIDRVPVKLRELDPGDFPVAVRYVSSRDLPFDEAKAAEKLANPLEIRWDGRALYEPEGDAGLDRAELQRRLDEGELAPLSGCQNLRDRWGGRRETAPVTIDRLEEWRLVGDDRAEKAAAIESRVRDLVLCGGRLHDRTAEPAWELDVDRRYPSMRAVQPGAHEIERVPKKLHRADRAEAAEAVARDGADDVEVRRSGLIEVLIPEALALRLDDIQLVHEAKWTVANLADELAEADVAYFTAYARLRDAARGYADARRPEWEVSDELADAVRGMLEAMPERTEHDMENWKRRHLEAAYGRWEAAAADREAAPGYR